MTYQEWAARHPVAAAELQSVLQAVHEPDPIPDDAQGHQEAWAQQNARFKIAEYGGLAFRNNNGATPARCTECGTSQPVIRYGLANDSSRVNSRLKSSDLICIIRRRITSDMVGQYIGQFGAIECKRPGWRYTGRKGEAEQAAFGALVEQAGGFFQFSTGAVNL